MSFHGIAHDVTPDGLPRANVIHVGRIEAPLAVALDKRMAVETSGEKLRIRASANRALKIRTDPDGTMFVWAEDQPAQQDLFAQKEDRS